MDVLSPDLGMRLSGVTAKKGAKGHFWSWKKFAALLDGARAGKAKLAQGTSAGTASALPVQTELSAKTDAQLRLSRALMDRTKAGGAGTRLLQDAGTVTVSDLTGRLTQLMTPKEPIAHGPLITVGEGIAGRVKEAGEKKARPDGLETLLQILSLNLEQVPGKAGAEAGKKKAPTGTHPDAGNGTTVPKMLGRAMLGEALGLGPNGAPDSPAVKELLAAMGLKEGAGLGKDGRMQAAMAQLQSRAQGRHELQPGTAPAAGKGRGKTMRAGRAAAGAGAKPEAAPAAGRGEAKAAGMETVRVEHTWDRVLKDLDQASDPAKRRGETAIKRPKTDRPAPAAQQGTAPETPSVREQSAPDPVRRLFQGSLENALEEAVIKGERRFKLAREEGSGPVQAKPKAEVRETPGRTRTTQTLQEPALGADDAAPGKNERPTAARPMAQPVEEQVPGNRARTRTPSPAEPAGPDAAPQAARQTKGGEGVADTRPAPPPRPPQPMFSQVEAGLRHAYIVRPKSVTVRIVPEEMGEIQVQVSMEHDKVAAKIHTESHKVAHILKEHQAELENRMRDQGMQLDKLDIRQDDSRREDRRPDQQNTFAGGQGTDEQRGRRGSRGERGDGSGTGERAEGETAQAVPKAPRSIYDEAGRLSVTA